jgi:hypothetical protein
MTYCLITDFMVNMQLLCYNYYCLDVSIVDSVGISNEAYIKTATRRYLDENSIDSCQTYTYSGIDSTSYFGRLTIAKSVGGQS